MRQANGWLSTYWVSPRDISTATLDRVWAPDTDHTAAALQLRPAPNGGVTVGLLVRYATAGPHKQPPLTGSESAVGPPRPGCARRSLLTPALPRSRPRTGCWGPVRRSSAPIGASGIIVGTALKGHPLLVDLAAAAPGGALDGDRGR